FAATLEFLPSTVLALGPDRNSISGGLQAFRGGAVVVTLKVLRAGQIFSLNLALGPDHNAFGASHQTFRGCATVRFAGRINLSPTVSLTDQCFDEINTNFDPMQNHPMSPCSRAQRTKSAKQCSSVIAPTNNAVITPYRCSSKGPSRDLTSVSA